MTCIVALVDKESKTLFMGGDSAAVVGNEIRKIAAPKVFRVHNMLIGCTTSFRMLQLLSHYAESVTDPPSGDALEYLITSFVPGIRRLFADEGFSVIENNREQGGFFVVGLDNRLFVVQSDFSVLAYTDSFEAVGDGESYALGSLYSTHMLSPSDRVLLALRAAEHFSGAVSRPFTVLTIP